FVLTNQSWSLLELLAKQNTVAIKNGTVGRIGSTIPTEPSPRQRNPSMIQKILSGFLLFIFFHSCFPYFPHGFLFTPCRRPACALVALTRSSPALRAKTAYKGGWYERQLTQSAQISFLLSWSLPGRSRTVPGYTPW